MYEAKRPTCVTVIGWAWIIMGGLMFVSAIMALFMYILIGQISPGTQGTPNFPAIFRFYPLLAIGQIGVALVGLFAGIKFLKLKAWSRSVLETMTWLMLAFIFGFSIFWIYSWNSMASGSGPLGFAIMGSVMGIVSMVIYAIPLGIMIKYLRGEKVRCAMEAGIGQSVCPGTEASGEFMAMRTSQRSELRWVVIGVLSFMGLVVIAVICLFGFLFFETAVLGKGKSSTFLKIKHPTKNYELWIDKCDPVFGEPIYGFILSADGKRGTQSCGRPVSVPASTRPTNAKWLEQENKILINFEDGQAVYLKYNEVLMEQAAKSSESTYYVKPTFSTATPDPKEP